MNRTARYLGITFLSVLGLGVPGVRAQQPVSAEPQAPSGTVQAPREVVPALPVPRLVKFAGTMKDELGKSRTGVVGVTFAIYNEQEGGAALWLETQNVELDEQGRYTVLLGATKSEGLLLELFTTGEPRWLAVQANLPKEIEQPRVLLVSVPYALKAADAETLSGLPASAFALAAPSGPVSDTSVSGTTTQTSAKSKTAGKTTASRTAKTSAAAIPPATNFIPVFLDNTGTNLGSSPMFQSGSNIGLGTTTPAASLDVQLTTGSPTNALNSTITLNNSSPITGSVLSAFKMTLNDVSTAANLSKQPARFVYLRDAAATGGVTAFDSVMTATSFLSGDAPYPLRGVNIEGPTIVPGKTLFNFTGLYIGSPGGAGAVTNKFALVTEPNAGNVGMGTTAPSQKLEVAGNVKISGGGNALVFPDGTVMTSAGAGTNGGTITGVTAGTGLSGGGTAGGVVLNNAGVLSFNGRSGLVTPIVGDYLFSQISGAATTTQLPAASLVRAITYLAGCVSCNPLTTADSQNTIFVNLIGDMTINSVTCFSDAGAPTVNIQNNHTGTLTNVLSANLTCSTAGATSSSFSTSALSLNDSLNFVMATVDGVAKRVTVIIKATVN